MKVLLIEPPHPRDGHVSFEVAGSRVFSPPWLLMCLWTYLQQRTRHECFFTDARLYSDVENELLAALELSQAEVVVVHVVPATTGEATAVLDIVKRNAPSVITVVCGPYPSQFPNEAPDLGRADYAMAGDPEPILRDLLEYHGIPRKLVRIPGLLARWMPAGRSAYWLDDLRSLSLPDWTGVFWSAYANPSGYIRVAARVSRGHTKLPADRALGDLTEPLRIWPLERFAVSLQKTTGVGIHEVFLNDPPGFWSFERLQQWCQKLVTERNTQHWSFRMLPSVLTDETVEQLQRSGCVRIEFLYPSASALSMQRYGSTVPPRDFRATLNRLEQAGIRVHLRFWLAGPESPLHETHEIRRILATLDYPAAAFELHPFCPDSLLAKEHPEAQEKLAAWLSWLKDPWLHARPVLAWGGSNSAANVATAVQEIEQSVRRDPVRCLKRAWAYLTGRNWINHWETRAAELWTAMNVARDLHDQRSK